LDVTCIVDFEEAIENSAINTNVGTVLATIGTPTNYSITAGNGDGFFKINNTGQIQVIVVR
jgi:hypothetical protein